MNRLHYALAAMPDYVFVNNRISCTTHANGALYLGPRVFLRTQIHKIKIRRILFDKAGRENFADGQHWSSVSTSGGSINTTVSYGRPLAALIYIPGIAVPVAYGVRPVATGIGLQDRQRPVQVRNVY